MDYATIDPSTGQEVKRYAPHSPSEVATMLDRAHAAYAAWRTTTFGERSAVLRRAAELMRRDVDELSRLITLEMGKLFREAKGETMLCADIFDYYAANAEMVLAPKKIPQTDGTAEVRTQPLGIIFGIEPWNFPYYQLVRVVAPNLMIGNVVVIKHAPGVPQCAERFERLMLDAGAPEGVYTNARLDDDQAAKMVADMRVRGVALTGSNRAGTAVAAEAGKAMKRSTLELGGSDPFIVLDDADLDGAVTWAVWSRLLNNGQGCVDAKRFIVVEPLYDRFLAGVQEALIHQVVGDPMDDSTTVGPLSSERARDGLVDQIRRAVDGGAKLIAGGKAIDRAGFFLEPTILADIAPDNAAGKEEFFGPVFLMFKVKDEDAAVALANDTEFGLSSAVFSEDVDRAQRVADRIEAGMVFVNHGAWTAPELPFGGVKNSGYGRELGELGLMEFVNRKLVRVQDVASEAL